MTAEADIPLEIPIRMPSRLYAPARARYYLDLGVGRDDEALPPFTPSGALLARRVSRVDRYAYSGWIDSGGIYRYEAPAEDVALNPADFSETSSPPTLTLTVPPTADEWAAFLRAGRGARAPVARQVTVPDRARCVALVTTPALERVPPERVLPNGAAKPRVEFYPAPVLDALVGILAVEVPQSRHGRYLVRRDGGPVADPRPVRSLVFDAQGRPQAPPPAWWEAVAGEVPCVFAPSSLPASYRIVVKAELRELDAPELALVMDPHPWLTSDALPPSEGPLVGIVVSYDFQTLELRPFRRVRTNLLLVRDATRTAPKRREEGWVDHHRQAPSGNEITKALNALPAPVERGIRSVARTAAVQIVLAAATLGAGAVATTALAQAAEAGIASSGINVSGAVGAVLSSSGAPSPVPSASSPLGAALEKGGELAPVAEQVLPVAAPEATNKALAEAAKAGAYVAPLTEFYGTVFNELVIEAQLSQHQRDELRLDVAEIKLMVAQKGGATLAIAVALYQAVRGIVLTVGTGGAAEAAQQAVEATASKLLDAAQKAVSAITQALEAYDQRELMRIVEDKIRAANADAIAALEAELNRPALEAVPANAPAPLGTPSSGPAAAATPEAPAPASGFLGFLERIGAQIGELLEELGRTFNRQEV